MSSTRKRAAQVIGIGIGLGVVGFIAPEVYSGTFSDFGTFARVCAMIAGLAAWVAVVTRLLGPTTTGRLVAFGPVVLIAGLVLWPYLRPATEVDEALPLVAGDITAGVSSTAAPDSDSPSSSVAATRASSTTSTTAPTTTSTTSVPPEPVELRRAGFQGLTGHRGSGDVAVYRLADESILLRFEDVDIGSGPALEVYVVPGEDQRELTGAFHVAPLTAERGNQNYTAPAEVDLTSGAWTVLVWCETFDVEVANATLT